ncbi:uncharacterized protein LOC112574239 [Pomacea canaliculata]|nr:uncharacterized protein LOC112574239 [Pomacea canaliculata]
MLILQTQPGQEAGSPYGCRSLRYGNASTSTQTAFAYMIDSCPSRWSDLDVGREVPQQLPREAGIKLACDLFRYHGDLPQRGLLSVSRAREASVKVLVPGDSLRPKRSRSRGALSPSARRAGAGGPAMPGNVPAAGRARSQGVHTCGRGRSSRVLQRFRRAEEFRCAAVEGVRGVTGAGEVVSNVPEPLLLFLQRGVPNIVCPLRAGQTVAIRAGPEETQRPSLRT